MNIEYIYDGHFLLMCLKLMIHNHLTCVSGI